MPKQNLVLIHSFPTNSILLKGLIDYLDDFVNVYFIDLPGFVKQIPPLKHITLNNYAWYVEKKIKEFNLKSYYLGGISFGFMVINKTNVDKKCKGIFAIEPYTGYKSLKMGIFWRLVTLTFLKSIKILRLSEFLWNNSLFIKFYTTVIFNGYPKTTTECILDNLDARTFVETTIILLKYEGINSFHKLPHALIINKDDIKVSYEYLTNLFRNNIKRLLIVDTKIDHYPKRTLIKSYFETKFPKSQLNEVLNFFSSQNKIDTKIDIISEISYKK